MISRCKFKNFSPIFQTFLGKSALAVLTKGEGKKSIKTIIFRARRCLTPMCPVIRVRC